MGQDCPLKEKRHELKYRKVGVPGEDPVVFIGTTVCMRKE